MALLTECYLIKLYQMFDVGDSKNMWIKVLWCNGLFLAFRMQSMFGRTPKTAYYPEKMKLGGGSNNLTVTLSCFSD